MEAEVTSDGTAFIYRNDTSQPVVVYVEPWAHDFTVLPGQRLRVLPQGDGDGEPYFQLDHASDGLQLWCERTCAFEAWIDGIEVECGHNRGCSRA